MSRKGTFTAQVDVRLSPRQYAELKTIAFITHLPMAVLGRMAILAMIDFEFHHLADVAAEKLKQAAE